jgi:hypothetical protein
MLSEFSLLFHHNQMRVFLFRDSIILFISASEVGTVLFPWNLQGNGYF